VSAFSATTRLYGVLRYSTLSIMSGVTSNAPGRVPNSGSAFSRVVHSHAGASCATLSRVMSASAEYFVPPASPPYTGHSTVAVLVAPGLSRTDPS